MTDDRVGRYRLERALPEARAQERWLAYDPLLDRRVELCRLPDARRLSTLRAVIALDHRAIVPVFGVEEGPEGVYVATAHVVGRPLADWLRERSRSVAEILDVMLESGAALAAAHARGLGHGAFGPTSVLLGWDGRVYVRGLGDAPAWTERDDTRAFVHTLAGALAETPAAEVPEWVRRTLARSAEPPRLAPLLRRLATDPREARRRRFAWAGAAVALAALVAVWVVAPWRAPPCPEAVERLVGVWDTPMRARVEAAFLGSRLPEAGYAWTAAASALDAYAKAWLGAHQEACAATHVRAEETAADLDLRMACLDARRRELAGLASVFAEADTETVRRAPQALAALSPIARCADVQALARGLRGPTDAAAKERAARLARARTLRLAGRYDDALGLARAVAAEAHDADDRALEAEADTLIGLLEVRARRSEAAEEALLQGAFLALAVGHDSAFAEASSALVSLGYEDHSRQGRAQWWAAHARTALDRAGNPVELERALALRLGDVEIQQGHLRDALRHFERGLALTPADDSAARAIAEDRLGRVHRLLDEPTLALEHQERALAMFVAAHGPEHPNVAIALQAVALALRNADRPREALGYHQRAIAMQERTLGSAHPDRAGMENGLAITLWNLGDAVAAHRLFTSALSAYEARFGERHVTVASLKSNLALVLLRLGRAHEAEAMAEDALRLTTALRGPEHPDTADALVLVAQCTLARSPRRALAYVERALALARAAAAPEAPRLAAAGLWAARIHILAGQLAEARPLLEQVAREADPKDVLAIEAYTELGRTLSALHDETPATAALERAVELATKRESNPIERGHAYLELARHLAGTASREAHARAVLLFETARAAFSSAVPVDADAIAEIERLRSAR